MLILFSLALPWLAIGTRGALRSTSNDTRQWLPRGFHETDIYTWFQDHFGRDEIAIVTWPKCTLDNPQVDRLADALTGASAAGGSTAPGPYFQRAITGTRLMRQLTTPPLSLSFREAADRLEGILIGPDGRTTCIVLIISEEGEADRAGAVEEIHRAAKTECGLPREALRLGGPTVDAATIDVESQRLLLELAGISALIAFVFVAFRLRSIRMAVLVLVTAIYSTSVSLSILYYTGGHMNLLMTMLSPLIYVLSISAAVHLANYYRDAIGEVGVAAAPFRAVEHAWAPCLLAAATTAVGLLSLARSAITPIRSFGIYSALGMGGSMVVLFLLLPAALTLFPGKQASSGSKQAAGRPPKSGKRRPPAAHGSLGRRGVGFLRRFHAAVTAASVAMMLFLGWGLTDLKSTVKLQHRFSPSSEIIADYRWMETHLGPLVPMEVIVHIPQTSPLNFFERVRLVARLEEAIAELPEVRATMSAAAFAPSIPSGKSARDVARRRVLQRRLPHSRQQFVDAHFLAADQDDELWRISLRVNALGDVDYGRFVGVLRNHVEPLLESIAPKGTRATYTGGIPLIYRAQRELFGDLQRSFFVAFLVIGLVMILALRSFWAGFFAMVPNIFPAVLVFGFMGWTGQLVEIGSVMTASAALGIAVDDTFHFLTWFRRGAADGMPKHRALEYAFRRCTQAMVSTTLICGAGMCVFSFSSFMPIVHFAWLMVALLLVALVGDLIFLPAMLAGPLGRIFVRGIPQGLKNANAS